jgi:hypothetical protein
MSETWRIVGLTVALTIGGLFLLGWLIIGLLSAQEDRRRRGVSKVVLKDGRTIWADEIREVHYPAGFMRTEPYPQPPKMSDG